MTLFIKIRRGEGPFWGTLKRLAKGLLTAHVPVAGPTRSLFRLLYALHVAGHAALEWALRFFWYEPLFRSQCDSVGRAFFMEKLPYVTGHGRIVLGDHVRLCGKPAFAFGNRHHDRPELLVGDHTFIGHATEIGVAESVRIGKHCLIAGGAQIADHDGHPLDALCRRSEPPPTEAIRPVVIGDDVWIGGWARILKGVTVGDRAVIGACAVVTSDVPPDVVVAGNPARIVKHLAPPRHGKQDALARNGQPR